MRLTRALLSGVFVCLTVAFIVLNSRSATEPEESSALVLARGDRNSEKDVENNSEDREVGVGQKDRFVTPSLAELGGRGSLPEMNKDVLMVTRVPGAGGELLVLILQRLQGYNAFKHIRLPPGDDGTLSTLQQELLVEEITSIIRQEAIPLSFDGDVRFLNFTQFARQAPTFLSLVRDPMDPRTLERYRKGGAWALYRGAISHFCGQDSRCTKRNSKWALQRAKENVRRWYPVVGLLDHMEESLDALENKFPYFFKGAIDVYEKIRPRKKYSMDSIPELKPRAIQVLAKVLADEVEFYRWLRSRLLNETTDNG